MKYRKKPVVVEATQWFKNGDHLQVEDFEVAPDEVWTGDWACKRCGRAKYAHGWIDTLEGGHIVCPGDWIITGVAGEFYPCKPDIFEATYEVAE